MKRNSINTAKTKALISLLDDPEGVSVSSVENDHAVAEAGSLAL